MFFLESYNNQHTWDCQLGVIMERLKRHGQSEFWPTCEVCKRNKRHPKSKNSCMECYQKWEELKFIAFACLESKKDGQLDLAKSFEEIFNGLATELGL